MSSVIQYLIATLSITRHALFRLLEMHIQHSFGLTFPAGYHKQQHQGGLKLRAVYQTVPQSAPETHFAQFLTGSHWLHNETGLHKKLDKNERTCPTFAHKCVNPGLPEQQFDCFDYDEEVADPVEDEHLVIFDCPEYTYARKQFTDLFNSSIVSIDLFLNQPDCNRVAKFLTQVRAMRMKLA